MVNGSESEERQYLAVILSRLQQSLDRMDNQLSSTYQAVIAAKKHLWENAAGMDPAERAAHRVDVANAIDIGERKVVQYQKLRKLLLSPYFGRVDFIGEGQSEADSYYIGVHSFAEESSQENLIYDWRSPVASMFYDFAVGKAYFTAPMGQVEGEIRVKRQYKIKNGVMEYMLESAVNINDDVLQKELSSNSDEKMKNIVATIQKEQNVIIRNETSHELIIQGVAGSGKTSVALHRIAYLLYRYKESLTSRNVLIISPNKVFADYISNVLPELGEEPILEMSFDELAASELSGICRFQTFYQQVTELLEHADDALVERIKYKATTEFVRELDAFIEHADETFFAAKDLNIENVFISKDALMSSYQANRSMPVKSRLEKVAAAITGSARDGEGNRLSAALSKKIKAKIKKMYASLDVLTLYKRFYHHIGKSEMFVMREANTVEFADVFPLVYLKMYVDGVSPFDFVKHLLVDEMQDYTPIQYAVVAKLFPCKKTILGDGSQSVNPYSSTSLPEIHRMFPKADTVELVKSYRSTCEIARFAQRLKQNTKLIMIERHGAEPVITTCQSKEHEYDTIKGLLADFAASEHQSLGIICKTQAQANELSARLNDGETGREIHLLDFDSDRFHEGICITTAHLAKGLEFDHVIVPSVDARTYRTDMDKSLLYIACTRAMHKLDLTYSGALTAFLVDKN